VSDAEPKPDPLQERLDQYEQARDISPVIAVETLKGARFFVNTADNVVGRILFTKRNRGEFGVLETALETLDRLGLASEVEGTTFLDIGANIGTSSIAAVLWHGFHDALAIEPEPGNYKLLKLNALFNDVEDRFRTLPIAVSDESGHATLLLSPFNSGAHAIRIGRAKTLDLGVRPTKSTVEKASIDDLVERDLLDADRIGMVWIDVQGHEPLVLTGGASLFGRGVPTVMEYYPHVLRTAGQWRTLNRAVATYFTHFVDLREAGHDPEGEVDLREARTLSAYGSDWEQRRFTDLLLVKLAD